LLRETYSQTAETLIRFNFDRVAVSCYLSSRQTQTFGKEEI
jgi:hypothetical protein